METFITIGLGLAVTAITQITKKTGIRGAHAAFILSALSGLSWILFTKFTTVDMQKELIAFVTEVYGVSIVAYEMIIRKLTSNDNNSK